MLVGQRRGAGTLRPGARGGPGQASLARLRKSPKVCTLAREEVSVTPWGTPERDAPAEDRIDEEARQAPERSVAFAGRSVVAPVVLALTTLVGLAGAVLALLPAALRRRPAGRLGPRSAPQDVDTESEPLAR